jgi:glycerate kinase
LIKAALEWNVKRIILGIGGSATNDGGMGMARALGARFLDVNDCELPEGGAALNDLRRIDLTQLDSRLKKTEIAVACDVTNPLTGKSGAAAVFGPQKGATPEMVILLDQGLQNMSRIVQEQLGIVIDHLPGAGAAGGLGGGMVAFLGGALTSGVKLVMDVTGLQEKLPGSAMLFTGEGRLDGQSVLGKTISGVGKAALAAGVPVIAIVGSLGEGYETIYEAGVVGVTSIISRPMALDEALQNAATLVTDATARSLRLYLAGQAKL